MSFPQTRRPQRVHRPRSVHALQARVFVVDGVVQGVGFRPFVYRTATSLQLSGSVRNDGARVIVTAAGSARALAQLAHALRYRTPPLARVEQVQEMQYEGDLPVGGFSIIESTGERVAAGHVLRLTPDAGICEACEAELLDPTNRRHRHVFISCTDCGPRWSMLEALPYDRVRTSMSGFPMCPSCAAEYTNPADRRFHAESICCPHCGPVLQAFSPDGQAVGEGAEALAAAVAILRRGGIVALHGIGGFHLAVDATNSSAVQLLRQRKHRPAKPFAVMVRTVVEARSLVRLDEGYAALLRRAERPVIIAPVQTGHALADGVAPGLVELGVMLPSTALQHLLLHEMGVPLVMTSGNLSGEPLSATPDDAWRDLAGIADLLLMHNRPVVAPSDDTVLRRSDHGAVSLRRARGWSPAAHPLPVSVMSPVLAMGGDLKAAVALAVGNHAWLSPHLGDFASLGVQDRTAHVIARFVSLSGSVPSIVACDAHPGYASTALVERWQNQPNSVPWARSGVAPFVVQRVQHHHAHVAAVLAEYGVTRPVIALAYDGAGWGSDGSIWGGEVLLADLTSMHRVGALASAPMIGGDRTAREPWCAAMGWLHDSEGPALQAATAAVSSAHVMVAQRLAAQASVRHSSMGRLFDAVAAVLQLTTVNSYEGEAASRCEALAHGITSQAGTPFSWIEPVHSGDIWRFDPRDTLNRLAEQRRAGMATSTLAAAFHDSLAATSVRAALRAMEEHASILGRHRMVVLCGGVFQNVRLLNAVRHELQARGVTVLEARTLPANDGALAIGQAAIVASLQAAQAGSNS